MIKKVISLLMILTLLMGTMSFAEEDTWLTDDGTEAIFSDVNQDDWFYEPVMTMNRYGIISGYPDGTFKPQNAVRREEFAVMMVNALKLEIKEPVSTFADVADGYWASTYIETAKPYLTGWIRNGEYIFKPSENAVREDMAVALVRALNKPVSEDMLSELDQFEDADDLSDNLRVYMASAVHHKLMSGVPKDGKLYLQPKGTLIRAEAAAMLMAVIKEEKIVFDDIKVTFEEGDFVLTVDTVENGLKLSWTHDEELNVSGYKVVASINNQTPSYPDDGYARYLQNNEHTVLNYDSYNGGDVSKFTPGETYNFAITALTNGDNVTSNTVTVKMPEAVSVEGKEATLAISNSEDALTLNWSEIDKTGLQGYKVVASKGDSTPMYPDNGYKKWITDLNTRTHTIKVGDSYSGGDIGGMFRAGETYHFAITAVYSSGKISSNVVKMTMPGTYEAPATLSEKTPLVNVVAKDGYLEVSWSEISTLGLNGYKIVASKTNSTPVYPADGYAYWITSLSTHKKDLYPGTNYNNADFTKLEAGETYWISVTAVYSDGKIAGNAVQVTMPN